MRLRIKRNLLEKAYISLNLTHQVKNASHQTSIIYNFNEIKDSVEIIESTGLFGDTVSQLKGLDFWNTVANEPILSSTQLHNFILLFDKLHVMVDDMIEALNQLIPEDDENVLSIKLPNPESLSDLSNISNSLDKIFNQTLLHPSLNGSVQILNFDMGSYWIDVAIGGGAVVMHFISSLAWGAAVTYKKLQEGLLVRENVRAMQIENSIKETVLNGIKENENAVAQIEAAFIANEYYKDFTNEDIERIKLALKELAKLYSKGGELHLSLKAPEEIKKEFPKMKEMNTIKSKIKEIEEPRKKKKNE